MQIIFISEWKMVATFFIVWPLLQLTMTMICNCIPLDKFNDNLFLLKTYKWEKEGQIYKKVFKIHRWKHLLPDGAKVHKNGFEKKYLKTYERGYLEEFILQTGRAEISHWLQIFPFWVFGLWCPPYVVWCMLFYAILVNLPCILAQRYNRPRLIRVDKIVKDEYLKNKINNLN